MKNHWKSILRSLQGVLVLLRLVKIEFLKMKRRAFFLLATLAAMILPIPISLLTARTGQGYDFLYKTVINVGHCILLIPVLGIVSTILFFEERDNGTLKNILCVPVERNRILGAKLIVLLIISLAYSIISYLATLVGAFVGDMPVEHFFSKLGVCVAMGGMTWVATLPCVAMVIAFNKNYIASTLVSFIYAILGFIITNVSITQPVPNIFMILPVNVITRWLLPYFEQLNTANYPFDINLSSVSTLVCTVYLVICILIFDKLIRKFFDKWN